MLWEPVFIWELHLRDKLQLAEIQVFTTMKNLINGFRPLYQIAWVKCFAYLELHNKLSPIVRIPVNWHALILNTFDVTVLDDFAC